MSIPEDPKIYHIVHLDKLKSIQNSGLWCDNETKIQHYSGTNIGIERIKEVRRNKKLSLCDNLNVADCVPFYFCPRSVMLYKIYRNNDNKLPYKHGQEKIIHIQIDLYNAIEKLDNEGIYWTFTNVNAAAGYTEFFTQKADLKNLDWSAIQAHSWGGGNIDKDIIHKKQAEF